MRTNACCGRGSRCCGIDQMWMWMMVVQLLANMMLQVMMVVVMGIDQGRWRVHYRWHFMHLQYTCFVLLLGTPQGCLQGHDTLPVGCQATFLTVAKAKFAIAFVAPQFDFQAVIVTASTIRFGSWCARAAAGAGGTTANAILRIVHVRVGHCVAAIPVTVLRNHSNAILRNGYKLKQW